MKLSPFIYAILDSLHEGVIVVDRETTIVYVNQAYYKQAEIPRSTQLVGSKLTEWGPGAKIMEVLRSRDSVHEECCIVEAAGRYMELSIVPIIKHAELCGVVAVIHEVQSEQEDLETTVELPSQEKKRTKFVVQYDIRSILPTRSTKMRTVVELAKQVAEFDVPVLIYGETGVGKEVLAKAIHQCSPRSNEPFIPINMAAIPDSLFESELFGYEEGAFTGSRKGGKRGLVELASGGTLFLDEIGELSPYAQAKLLRVLQEKTFRRVGGEKTYTLNAHIISATNRDLRKEVQNGTFREDLYYRLSVIPIYIPPLRDRIEDLPMLSSTILEELNRRYHANKYLSHASIRILSQYQWPGNVRELYSVLEHMFIMSSGNELDIRHVPEHVRESLGQKGGADETVSDSRTAREMPTVATSKRVSKGESLLEKHEKELIENVLKRCRTRTEAMRELGLSRKGFYAKLRKYGLLL